MLERAEHSRRMLRHAERQVSQRVLEGLLVVAADAHHVEVTDQLLAFMDEPWRRTLAASGDRAVPAQSGERYQAGRLQRIQLPSYTDPPVGGLPAPARACKDVARRLGVDRSIVSPTDSLSLGGAPAGRARGGWGVRARRWPGAGEPA